MISIGKLNIKSGDYAFCYKFFVVIYFKGKGGRRKAEGFDSSTLLYVLIELCVPVIDLPLSKFSRDSKRRFAYD